MELKSNFKFKRELQLKYKLRNRNSLIIPSIGKFNNYYKNSFAYFFSTFINELLIQDLNLMETRLKLGYETTLTTILSIF